MLRSMKYGINGAVLAGLVAAPVLWTGIDKSVHLEIDGRSRTVSTTASSVGQVLSAHGYKVTGHDLLAPSAKSAIHDGTRIVLRHGRLLHLNVDGRATQIWTTAPTVDAALAQLGYTRTDFVSVSRSRRLPLTPTTIAIRTPRSVTVTHDGTVNTVSTTDATVGAVLADMSIPVGPNDILTPAAASPVHADEAIRIQRVENRLVVTTRKVPFRTTRTNDTSMTTGTTEVITAGKAGRAQITYAMVYVDGRLSGRTRVGPPRTLAAPRAEVMKVGTKPLPKQKAGSTSSGSGGSSGSSGGSGGSSSGGSGAPSAPTPSPGSAKAIAKELLAKRGWGDDQYSCLVTLWNHESGWRVHAANPSGAYGIPQALPGSKMSSAGSDWQDSAETQIKWGLGYIAARYHNPCDAWSTWQAHGGWYY